MSRHSARLAAPNLVSMSREVVVARPASRPAKASASTAAVTSAVANTGVFVLAFTLPSAVVRDCSDLTNQRVDASAYDRAEPVKHKQREVKRALELAFRW